VMAACQSISASSVTLSVSEVPVRMKRVKSSRCSQLVLMSSSQAASSGGGEVVDPAGAGQLVDVGGD